MVSKTKTVKSQSYKQCHSVRTMFIRSSDSRVLTIIIVYADDIIITYDDVHGIHESKAKLCQQFETKDIGKFRYFMSKEIARNKEGMSIFQGKYIIDLLKKHGSLVPNQHLHLLSYVINLKNYGIKHC